MPEKGVSELLYSVIQKLMNQELFGKFLLGGGTNLAIKHNHRVSTDIDLFSSEIVGTDHLNKICDYLKKEFGENNVLINKQNFGSEQLAYLQIYLLKEEVKIDVIQNLKLLYEAESIDGIRLINDNDIGALKLLAAADRGNQKDFYDLYLLTEIEPLVFYYDILNKRQSAFKEEKDKTIFDIQKTKPIEDLKKDLTSLGDFTKAGDKKNPGNRIVFTSRSTVKIDWPTLRKQWLVRVKELATNKSLIFKETASRRNKRGIGNWFLVFFILKLTLT